MPLAFQSISHGEIAFGFFNIETDCLLLDRLFFFCDDFCAAVDELRREGKAKLDGFTFDSREKIGDLLGAINGVRFTGFLGELYRRWPFPQDPEGFRQKLYGSVNRAQTIEVLEKWGAAASISLSRLEGGLFPSAPMSFPRKGSWRFWPMCGGAATPPGSGTKRGCTPLMWINFAIFSKSGKFRRLVITFLRI